MPNTLATSYEKDTSPAACYIAFFSLIRVKYSSLMHAMCSHGGVVVAKVLLASRSFRSG